MIRHHGDHRALLHEISSIEALERQRAGDQDVDAVIVPAARGAEHVKRAMEVAEGLGCTLLVLCSRQTSAAEVRQLPHNTSVTVEAVDIPTRRPTGRSVSTSHKTTKLLRRKGLLTGVDTSLKRNIGLAIAQLCGWRRVFLLDDDVSVPRLDDVRFAATLLDRFGAVGLDNVGFRDNSVVCHALRKFEVGEYKQTQFISTMALMVDPVGVLSFFPHIYNEDWMYLIGDGVFRRGLALTGQVSQDTYDPFRWPDRAVREELGDTIAEGLFWLLDDAQAADDALWKKADRKFWAGYLSMRRELIEELVEANPANGGVGNSLDAAQKANGLLTPTFCAKYVGRWRRDLKTWRKESADRISRGPISLDTAVNDVLARSSKFHL